MRALADQLDDERWERCRENARMIANWEACQLAPCHDFGHGPSTPCTPRRCTADFPSGLDCHDESDEAVEPFYDDWCEGCKDSYEPPGAGADPYGRTAEDWAHHAE